MAVRFDAVGDQLNRTANLPPNGSFTYMMWVQIDNELAAGTYQPFIWALDATSQQGYATGVVNGVFDVEIYNGGTLSSFGNAASRPAAGQAACIYIRCSGTGAGLAQAGFRLATSNTFVNTATATMGSLGTMTQLYMGGLFGVYWMDGRRWNIKCWDRALSDAEILAESYFFRPQYPANLNFWLPLPNANDLADRSGNGRNPTTAGTLTTADGWGQVWKPSRKIFLPQASGSATDLTIQSATHAHSAESLVLTTDSTLSIASATHAHTAGNLTLSTALALVVADAVHAHSADSPTISTGTTLSIDSASHGHQADNVVLSTAIALAINNASHAHTAANVDLSTAVLLAVDGAVHAHAADNLTLDTTVGATLVIAGAVHAHAADSVVLTSDTALAIANAVHAHTADQLALSVESVLAIASATHAHQADHVTLGTADVISLAIADALHAHAADNLDLDLMFSVSLVIQDAVHGHTAETVVLSLPGGYPDPADVRQGVAYGPTGVEYVGTFKGGKGTIWVRRR